MKKSPFDPEIFRELSARTVMFHQAVAERMGLSSADHKCLDLIERHGGGGRITPGRVAELTGLTTGAVTGVLDRLESAGFVWREKDPDDRRQIIVHVRRERMDELAQLFEPIGLAVEAICAEYTAAELERIMDFTRKCIEATAQATEVLRRAQAASAPAETNLVTVPRGTRSTASFEARRGVAALMLGATTVGESAHLVRARFEGAPPTLSMEDGVVSYTHPRGSPLDWLRMRSKWVRVTLARDVRWAVRIKGGAAKLEADLGALSLSSFDLLGGANDLLLQLGRPEGVVPVRIKGGASTARIQRPRNVAMKLVVHGGVSGLAVDSMKLGSVGGLLEWASPDFEAARDRFELELHGGASDLTLESV